MSADALGYAASFAALAGKDLFDDASTRLPFFRTMSYVTAHVGLVGLAFSAAFFIRRVAPFVETGKDAGSA